MEKSQNNLKLFENKKIRYVWNAEEEEWYFSVVDIVEVLTESVEINCSRRKVTGNRCSLHKKCTPLNSVNPIS